jgi:hypothetical protein
LKISEKFLFFFMAIIWVAFALALPRMTEASQITGMTSGDAGRLSADASRWAASAKRNLRLQTELPADTKDISPRDYRFGIRWNPRFGSVEFLKNFSRIILFCAVAVIVSIILVNLKNNLWSDSRARKIVFVGDQKEAVSDAVSRMEHAQTEADDLAREGSFAEAIHILLLRSVGEMRSRLSGPIAASLTSRELLRKLDLSPSEREVFGTIVQSVEISYFGGREPGEDEYLVCRRSFDALTDQLRRHSFG